MRALARKSLVSLLACAAGLLAWRLWPEKAPPPAEIAIARTSHRAASEPVAATPIASTLVPIAAAVDTSAAPELLDEQASLRVLASLSVSDKPRALELAFEADAKLPPEGVLAEARRALIVTLLVDTGRMAEARIRARKFIAEYPTSRYLPLVQGVTGIHPRPTPSQMRDAR